MRSRAYLIAALLLALLSFGLSPAQAARTAGEPTNHGQCVSNSPAPDGKGGRSATAKDKNACAPPAPLTCHVTGNASRNSADNTVTVTGTGPNTPGSSLECDVNIPVTGGSSTIQFTYEMAAGTNPCGGGVPRIFVQLEDGAGGTTYPNTIDSDPECSQQTDNGDGTFTVTYTIPTSGTVTRVGFVYDRGDTGSVVFSDTSVGGVVLDV